MALQYRLLSRLSPALPVLALLPLLGGCNLVVLDPAGDVARQQGNLVLLSTLLMLVIIVPVMALTVFFAWRYRAGNKEATYKPDWDHSTQLELAIWGAPLLIIICLGALTWVGTHLLDPYRPLARTAPGRPVAQAVKPLEVQVVALDWKWLFIYPEQGVATVNELAAPVDRPVRFRISGSSVMNSFYIPALAGQIYAMPGMETKLHGVFNHAGDYSGFSANYSGAGFSGMRFRARALAARDFEAWVKAARSGGGTLDRAAYLKLERPSEKEPVRRFATVEPQLFDRIVNLCVDPGKMCMHDMMALDAKGGAEIEGAYSVADLAYDKFNARGEAQKPGSRRGSRTAAACTSPMMSAERASPPPASLAPLRGMGLARPGQLSGQMLTSLERAPVARPAS